MPQAKAGAGSYVSVFPCLDIDLKKAADSPETIMRLIKEVETKSDLI
jgi:hypothetical protein